jgi:phenylalanyl-tRNA synthetase beta chain
LLGYPKVEFTRSDHIAYHPNQSANVLVDGTQVGVIGRLNPVLESEFEIGKAVAFSINLDHLPPLQRGVFTIPSRYPSVSRDITLSCALSVESTALCHAWDSLSLPELCDVTLVDVFHTEDHKNITYRFTFRSHENTISEKQIQKWVSSLTKAVAEFSI